MINILVAVPKVKRPLPPKLESYLKSTKFPVAVTENLGQELARTTLVEHMFNKKFDAIAFIDSDMSPNVDLDSMFEKFWHLDFPVISALTSSKGREHKILLFEKHPHVSYPMLNEHLYEADSIIKVYAIGFGACLIRREVFEKIDLPWFKTNWEYVVPETGDLKIVGGVGMGADFYFSMKCNQNDIPIYLDCGTLVHHMELDNSSSYYGQEFPWPETIQRLKADKDG